MTTAEPEIIELANAKWTRSRQNDAWLESVSVGASVLMREEDVRALDRRQEVERKRAAKRAEEAEREHQAFLARPRVTLCGVEWVRFDPDQPDLLCSIDQRVIVRASTLRAREAQRATEAEQARTSEARQATGLQEQVARLQEQLQALLTANPVKKEKR